MFGGAAQRSGSKEQFLEQAKAARQERACERRREQAASVLQAAVRGFLCRQRLRAEFRREFDAALRAGGEGPEEEAGPPVASSGGRALQGGGHTRSPSAHRFSLLQRRSVGHGAL